MKILLTGGGTGGHIIPLLSVVDELKKIAKNHKRLHSSIGTMESTGVEFLFIAPASDFNKNILEAGIEIKIIKAGKLRRYLIQTSRSF
jgi:UDP-N-acetylglucosamine:LPS N-acetylglucosamine transferase